MVSSPVDVYQARYLEHQSRKRRFIINASWASGAFFGMLQTRRSQRIFNGAKLTEIELDQIYEAIWLAPSSCNRQAILVKPVEKEEEKAELDNLLVGGKDWLKNAQIVLLLFADMLAYKSPVEGGFMPYLDAGFVGENVYLAAEALGIGGCYVNPSVREENRARFDEQFNPRRLLFCGAMALGKYTVKALEPPKRKLEGIFY